MFMLLYFGHEFGISENFRIMCAADGAGELNEFFKFDWVSGGWNLMVALGAVFGGYRQRIILCQQPVTLLTFQQLL